MTERDDLLRGAVFAAFDAKGTDGMRQACERVVTVHGLWPLIEYEHAIERAEAQFAEHRRQEERELLDWYASIGYLDLETEAARAA